MKILVLTNLFPPHYLGGYELICYAVVGALSRRGHNIHILTSNHGLEGKTIQEEQGITRALRIHGFYGHPWLGIGRLRALEKYNNTILRETLETFKPDLVYVWNMGGLSKSMLLSLQQFNVPTVCYLSDHWIARGLTSDVWISWWNRTEASLAHRLARKLLTVVGYRQSWQNVAPTNPPGDIKFQRLYFCSKALRKLTANAGPDVMHGAVIYCPVDIDKFTGTPKPESQPIRKWLWVGRLAEDKGIMTCLKAVSLLQGRFPGELHIYGKGEKDYVTKLTDFVAREKLRVHFRSASMEEMPQVYRDHDALLFTSEWAEPFALTPLEAMSSGLPVIGTTTGGSREIFRHGDNALTYSAGNAEELAQRILELHDNNALRVRLATTGHAEVRATYAEPIIVDQIEAYLKETVVAWQPAALPPLR